jgi:hypothetical protein
VQRFVVVPRAGQPYTETPKKGSEHTYHVQQNGVSSELTVTIQAVIEDWSPQGIRIEGYTWTTEGARGVLGYYDLNSTANTLGVIEIQDT